MMVLMTFIFLELLQIFCCCYESLFKNRLYWSVGISISGLIANELITILTPELNRYFCSAWKGLLQREKIGC